MLAASRALAHAPWRPVIAATVRRSATRPRQRSNFSATVARTRPAISFDTAEDRTQPKLIGKAIFRNYATSSQSLQLLVDAGRYQEADAMLLELRSRGTQIQPHPVYVKAIGNLLSQEVLGAEDRETLVHWFELLPDVRHSTPIVLQGLLNDLRHHLKAEPMFAVSVGRVLAQKGYKILVEDEILPLARSILNHDVFTLFEQELSQYLADFNVPSRSNTPTAMGHSEVFEDASEDYASVMAASTPPPPSVLEIVEAALPPILPAPDPTDLSVFEDEMDDDYVNHQPAVHSPRQFPADQLHQLVDGKRYDDAYQLLVELQYLHVEIPPSHTYGTVALEVLRRPLSEVYTLEDQSKLFAAWLSLIPPAHQSQGANSLQDIQRAIMSASLTNISLVMRFCTIVVGKGYSGLVGRPEMALAMRFVASEAVQQYIQDLEAANTAYWTTYQPKNAASEIPHFSQRVRNYAVRYLAYSGRVEDAVALIPERGSRVQLSAYTYDKLLRTIRDSNKPSYMRYISRIESLRAEVVDPDQLASLSNINAEAEVGAMAAELHTASVGAHADTLPETLRYLKRALRRPEYSPHPFVITEFLERYLAVGRTRAPTLLLNLAVNTSYRSASILLLAEMLYYRRMAQHHLIIQTFVDHFYLSGVPREDVLQRYHEAQTIARARTSSWSSEDGSSATRICQFSPSILSRGKAWPMKFHCNLVWHALVALTPTHAELENLYSKLLDLARGKDELRSLAPFTSLKPLLPPPSWRQPVDCAAFTPFMRRLMLHSGPNRGSQIISDMIDLGVQPSVYHFTELAGNYARIGEVKPAMVLLDHLETSSGLLERLKNQREEGKRGPERYLPISSSTPFSSSDPISDSESSATRIYTIPEPDLVFYVSLMRGFIISGSITGFEQVHKRLLQVRKLLPKKRFTKDQEALLNEVYADFRVLSQEQGYDWKKQRKVGFQTWLKVSSLSVWRVLSAC